MAGKSLPPRRRFGIGIVRRSLWVTCLRACNIGVEVFKPESKLVAIDPFRPSPKLRPLEPQNDGPESLDLSLRLGKLCLIARNLRSQVTHQLVQLIDVRRQGGEIDVHARESNAGAQKLPRRSSS
jgi:hypothetical protein